MATVFLFANATQRLLSTGDVGNYSWPFSIGHDEFGGGNLTNASTWFTREEVEHFLGDPDVLHAAALVLGATAVVFGKRLPQLFAAVSAVSFGLWVAVIIQDRQTFNQPLFGLVDLPEGIWVPIVAGLLTAGGAAALSLLAWRAALTLLTGGILMLIAVALCRLWNVSPDRIFKVGASLLSAYRVVGAVVLVLAVLVSAALVKKFHKAMIVFASAHLGTLLLLSGTSHFAQRAGVDAPFSLLDDLARIMAEVRGGRCHVWEAQAGEDAYDAGLKGCDCQEKCRQEILAWLASSWAVLIARAWQWWREKKAKKRKDSEEERKPLADAADSSPTPQAIGNKV